MKAAIDNYDGLIKTAGNTKVNSFAGNDVQKAKQACSKAFESFLAYRNSSGDGLSTNAMSVWIKQNPEFAKGATQEINIGREQNEKMFDDALRNTLGIG